MDAPTTLSRGSSFVWIIVAYGTALLVALTAALTMDPTAPLWWRILSADLLATVAIFGFSLALNNSSVYDAFWSVAPVVIAISLALSAEDLVPSLRGVFAVLAVTLWGARLTWNWARGWSGLSHEDWRYVDLRARCGRAYWLVSLVGIHLVPTALVFLGVLPLIPAISREGRPMNSLDCAALALTLGGALIEATADAQLRAFRALAVGGETLATGLWARSRHPNYLGEILFWWGVGCFGAAAEGVTPVTFLGAIAVHLLFVFISVPMLDRRSLRRRAGYAEHMKVVPGIFPRPWRTRYE